MVNNRIADQVNRNPRPALRRAGKILAVLFIVALMAGVLGVEQHPVYAGIPAGLTEYFIPGYSDDLMAILDSIETTSIGNTLTNITTVAIGGPATVYYDHWENGFQTGAAGDETYTAVEGTILTFRSNNIPYPRGTNLNACTGSTFPAGGTGGSATRCYDGRDRIYMVGGPASVAQAFWPTTSNTNFANAWEIYPVKPYQTSYTVPVGEDLFGLGSFYADFRVVSVMVLSAYDNNQVLINDPETPGVEVTTTLNRGQTVRLERIWSGTTVTADLPVEVQFLIGEDLVIPNQWNSRSYTAVPGGLWSTEYYSPVPGDTDGFDTDLFIYNPTGSPLTINYEVVGTTSSFIVPANATRSFRALTGAYVPLNSGVYLAAADGITKFWAIGGADSGSPSYNWGFTLLPYDSLTDEYYVSWAPGGWDQTGGGGPAQADYSPLFVTPTEDDTTVFVDYDANGTIDDTYVLDRLQVQRVFDTSDDDQTGTHIFATSPFAVTWGQDALPPSPLASPGLDAGYSILPLNSDWVDIVLDINKTANPTIIPDQAGETTVFTLVISTDTFPVDDVVVTDFLPANWAYVAGTTTITLPDSSTISGAPADPDISGQTLTWDAFPTLPLDMAANETLTIEFTAITTAAPGQASINDSQATGVYGPYTVTATDSASVDVSSLEISKTSDVSGNLFPGDTIEYTITINNTGSATQNNVAVTDFLPAGTTYVSQSTVVTADTASGNGTYRDEFTAQNYSNNNGTLNWTGSWIEGDPIGAAQSPTDGYVQVINDTAGGGNAYAVRMARPTSGNTTAMSISRQASLSACTAVGLTFDWDEEDLETDDDPRVQASTNGTTWTNVFTIPATNSNTRAGYQSESVNLNAYAGEATFFLRFSITTPGGTSDDTMWLDNIELTCTGGGSGTITLDNIPGGANPDLVDGNPPNLVTTGDNIDLPAGGVMTVVFQVTVNDPATACTINNIASVKSDEEPVAITGSVSDAVTCAPAVIGNYLWLDENGDGVQDAGEDGIANVVIELYDAANNLVATTTTDANGGYLFADLLPGSYSVRVLNSSLPAGLQATYDEDNGTTSPDGQTAVTVVAGQEYMTADFGYNWVPSGDSSNPPLNATGAIGDRLWIDADGDGVQDPGESGLGGVTVSLLTDDNGDGIYGGPGDNPPATTVTNSSGNYIFDGLAPGSYVVQVTPPAGYNQTGDPDAFGALCTTCDNQTTSPVVLAPGDVFVNADFGYQPSGSSSTIGDTIFLDSNGDGIVDAGEPGIPGVTVALLDGSGNVIATTVTDVNGNYSFPGLPAGTYTVRVTDTDNVLGELDPISDPDGGNDNQSTTTVDGINDDLDQDFGYAPPGHTGGDGLIGDTIFMDTGNGSGGAPNGQPDPGEGLEGVVVRLYDATGTTLLAITTTDENGNYYFGGLNPTGTYVVRVDPSTLPNGGAGLANTIDPDGGTANESTVNLGTSGPYDLDQDFGYTASTPNSISGTIWEDTDAAGDLDAGETGRFAGVTVALYDSNGNIVATTVTDANGNYSFPNLPDGTYQVDVTDQNNVLAGYWHSDGPNDGANNNSQDDPYTVTVSGGQNNTTADFGYYVQPAVLGDFVWLDLDQDGIQDANEPGIGGVEVTLTINYPNGNSVTLVTTTDALGAYSFGNLLLDEDFNGVGAGEPTFTVAFATPPGTTATPVNQGGDPAADSNGTSDTAAPAQGQTDLTYDSGFVGATDLGDLPENIGGSPDYPTLFAPGPSHIVFPDGGDPDNDPDTTNGRAAVWLGLTIDTEPEGQPSTAADGDGADEDGALFAESGWLAGGTSTIDLTLNSSESNITVYYGVWIDWNYDGDFTDVDDGFYAGSGVTGSPVIATVNVSIPASYVTNTPVYFRMRVADAPLGAADYLGTIVNGEVEDYRWVFGPTAVNFQGVEVGGAATRPGILWLSALLLGTVSVLFLYRRRRQLATR